jgi:archaemetzincin
MIIGLTAVDLWPGRGWNFVFGQAHPRKRAGIWSLYRNGDPEKDEENYNLYLLRTLKTAVHEAGHLYGIDHCTAYECCMCGSNHREESDRRPLWFCAECMPKVCWATGADPASRLLELADLCRKVGLEDEEGYYRKAQWSLAQKEKARAAP